MCRSLAAAGPKRWLRFLAAIRLQVRYDPEHVGPRQLIQASAPQAVQQDCCSRLPRLLPLLLALLLLLPLLHCSWEFSSYGKGSVPARQAAQPTPCCPHH